MLRDLVACQPLPAVRLDRCFVRHVAVPDEESGDDLAEECVVHPGDRDFANARQLGDHLFNVLRTHALWAGLAHVAARSEERRVGKECVSTCSSRWSPYHSKKYSAHTCSYHLSSTYTA